MDKYKDLIEQINSILWQLFVDDANWNNGRLNADIIQVNENFQTILNRLKQSN
jgi:hypothetical protein